MKLLLTKEAVLITDIIFFLLQIIQIVTPTNNLS